MNAAKTRNGAGKAVKPFDYAVLVLASILTLLAFVSAYSGGKDGDLVLVRGGGNNWVFPLSAGERLAVPGPLGETIVEIRGGEARIVSSPCTNQTCVAAGMIHTPGQWTACLPNRVMVSIPETDGSPDAVSW
ncbi:MAG: NusG domain II-containing protein [Treponema sp.]|jgi:hypothetical protein|nr:NusG domain II-containing protein [Treponema sp.]